MHIAFSINRLALLGLGATLVSLVRNCTNSEDISFWFLCSRLRPTDKQHIERLLRAEQFQGKVQYIDFDAKAYFGHLPALHGDWTAYGRLLIPRLIAADICLYLDADLIINLDIRQLQHWVLEGYLLAAVKGCVVAEALDGNFFIDRLSWRPAHPYFNSGVIIFNSKLWRAQRVDDKLINFCRQYGQKLVSHDQTLLNAICEGQFLAMPEELNNAWYPLYLHPEGNEPSITHFVGSPKPWDLLGGLLHRGYKSWQVYHTKEWHQQYGGLTFEKLGRYWQIRRSILKNIFGHKLIFKKTAQRVPAIK